MRERLERNTSREDGAVPGPRVELLGTLRSKRRDGFGLPDEAWGVAA